MVWIARVRGEAQNDAPGYEFEGAGGPSLLPAHVGLDRRTAVRRAVADRGAFYHFEPFGPRLAQHSSPLLLEPPVLVAAVCDSLVKAPMPRQ